MCAMKRLLTAVFAASALFAATLAGAGGGLAPAAAAPAAPVTGLTVTGTEVGMFPAFDPAITRYAVTTTAATGDVTVQVATEPGATVRVNGAEAPAGTATLSGLEAGEEISVLVDDAGDTTAYSLVYLPAGFPALEAVTSGPVTPGHVLLTLGLWIVPGAPFFETAVDEHGVPAYVRKSSGALDLKQLDNGHYLVARGSAVGGGRGVDVVELDETFTEVASYRTVGLVNTDGHDAILLPDGSHYLMAYESDGNGHTDAVVQHLSAAGDVLFSWNSADHMDIAAETVQPEPTDGGDWDYAHINSFQVMADGDLLLSFRHTSSVLKVARTAHDGFEAGEVVWRLGGRDSDFTFPDGTAGPCAQHTASELPNGDVMVFDNGSGTAPFLCPNPANPSGSPISRVPTRVAVFHLEPGTAGAPGVATTVRSIKKGGRLAIFAGSAEPLADDGVMVGWASNVDAVATEFDADDQTVWELSDPNPAKTQRYFTYRATKAVVPDAIDPEVTVSVPSGGTVVQGSGASAKVSCTDRGGSTLQTCDVTPIDTGTLGDHQVTVTATDGAGNTTTVSRDYTVVPVPQPDAFVKLSGSRELVGQGVYGGVSQQTLKTTLPRGKRKVVAVVKVRNDGAAPSRFGLVASKKGRGLAVAFTGLRGKTPRLDPGETHTLRVELRRTSRTVPGRTAVAQVRARSLRDSTVTDAVRVRVKVR